MVTDTTISDRTRYGGVFLTLGMLLTIVAFSLFISTPIVDPASPVATRAAQVAANGGNLQLASTIGVFGDVLVAAGAFFLVTRPLTNSRNIPGSAFFLFLGIAFLLFAVVDAVSGATVVSLARDATAAGANAAPLLATFAAVDGALSLLVGAGILAFALASIGVFAGEAFADARAMPKGLAYVGLLGGVLSLGAAFAPVTGLSVLFPLFFAFYLVALPLLFLGIKLAWPAMGQATAASRIAKA